MKVYITYKLDKCGNDEILLKVYKMKKIQKVVWRTTTFNDF